MSPFWLFVAVAAAIVVGLPLSLVFAGFISGGVLALLSRFADWGEAREEKQGGGDVL